MTRRMFHEDPLLLYLEVPYVCDYNDYCSPDHAFLQIPEQHGIHWDTAHNTEISSLKTEETQSFLQGWLFFATLNKVSSVLGVNFHPSDFIAISHRNQLCMERI